ncbi:unnamed protein product [Agarophyton chilense]
MPVIPQILLLLLMNLGVKCIRVNIGKTGIGPVPPFGETASQMSGSLIEAFSHNIQHNSSTYSDVPSKISSSPGVDVMDIHPSPYPEDLMASDSPELESIVFVYPSLPIQEGLMVHNLMETDEQDRISIPSLEAVVPLESDPQPSEAPYVEFVMSPSVIVLHPPDFPELEVTPTRSPAPFSGTGVSASTIGSSATLSGRMTSSRLVGITVALLTVFGTLSTVTAISFYGRNTNPYRPFITGASLSEESFDFAQDPVPETLNSIHNSRESNIQTRRYEAASLNRDIEPAERLAAAKLLEDIPDRHCR